MKLLITRKIDNEAILLLEEYFDITYFDKNIPLERNLLETAIPDFDAVLCCVSEKIDKEIIELGLPKLKIISNMAMGLDNVDVDFAQRNGISVFNLPNIVSDATADMTLALYLSLNRQIEKASTFVKTGNWNSWDPEIFCGRTLRNLTWGIIGMGNIGKAVAKRCLSFGVKLIFHDSIIDFAEINGTKIENKSLNEVLEQSDVVSLHIPLNSTTKKIIDLEKLSRMKKNAVLINMARGGVVDSNDLYLALSSNKIAGAALDVFDPEPIDSQNKILDLDNVIITPHIGTATTDCRNEMAIGAARNLINCFKESKKWSL